jgi:branched-chain amino acid transport system permease protein
VAFVAVPMLASDYMFRAILIPFLIMALAALGVNILVGYCGQISLGSGAFMAVGAYGAYNFFVRIPGMPLVPALILGGLCATAFGILFGLPSLRVKGLYLAVATLAAQFFSDWMFLRIKWLVNDSPSGSVSVNGLQVFGLPIDSAVQVLVLPGLLVVIALLAKNLVRSAIGREWMAIRDMDVAAAVIGIRPMYAKLSAFAVSSFIVGVAGALWAFVYLGAWEPAAFSVDLSFRLLFMVIIGGLGSIMGALLRRRLHRGAADLPEPVPAPSPPVRHDDGHRRRVARRTDDLRRADRLVPDRRAARPGAPVVHRQAEAAPVAVPALEVFRCPPRGPLLATPDAPGCMERLESTDAI